MEWSRLSEGPERERARQKAERVALPGMQHGMNAFAAFEKTAEGSVSEAISQARQALASRKDSESHFMSEQMLGYLLLNRYLADGKITQTPPEVLAQRDLSTDEQATVGFAMELLIDNNYHNADLVAAGLQTLKGYWPEARLRTEAQRAAQAAESYLADPPGCTECRGKQQAKLTSTPQRLDRIEAGVTHLEQLAQ